MSNVIPLFPRGNVPSPQHCHICGELAVTETVKCKLDACDGLEQEYCRDCARIYYKWKALYFDKDTEAPKVFELLQAKRKHRAIRGER